MQRDNYVSRKLKFSIMARHKDNNVVSSIFSLHKNIKTLYVNVRYIKNQEHKGTKLDKDPPNLDFSVMAPKEKQHIQSKNTKLELLMQHQSNEYEIMKKI